MSHSRAQPKEPPQSSFSEPDSPTRPQTVSTFSRWWPGVVAALPILLLALYPQLSFRLARGEEWNGTVAHAHGDEVVYGAYLNALIDGRPRRNDPYTGIDDEAGAPPLAESYFSIQFVPAYALALPARLLGLSSAQTFLLLTALSALASTLTVFWLLSLVTGDARSSAYGSVVVLCLGSANLAARFLITGEASNNHLSFLRRYQPSAAFPLLLLFCALVWLMFTRGRRRDAVISSLLAGLTFTLLVYSYFYLWTAAAAWLCCLFAACVFGRVRSYSLLPFAGVAAVGAIALVPYFILLSGRAPSTDEGLLLTRSHAPDLFRIPEIVGCLVLLTLLIQARRGLARWDSAPTLFTAAFAATPFVVFNQQIVTGLSLQPFHYEMFTVNYLVMVGLVLCLCLHVRRGLRRNTPRRLLWPSLALAALCSGAVETVLASKRFWTANDLRDRARPAALRLAEQAGEDAGGGLDTKSVVFVTDMTVADSLPAVAPQPLLWAPHMFNFPGVTAEEDRQRLAAFMYFRGVDLSGVDEKTFASLDGGTRYLITSLIRRARHNPNLTVSWRPISDAEIKGAVSYFKEFAESFDPRAARIPRITYVLTRDGEAVDFKNLDRWYERDGGEKIGEFSLLKVSVREAVARP